MNKTTSILKAEDDWLKPKKKTPVIREITETKGEEEDKSNKESCYKMLNDMRVKINKRY